VKLAQHSTTDLLEAIRERLKAIEQGEIERRGLLSVPIGPQLGVYRKLSRLLRSARAYVSGHGPELQPLHDHLTEAVHALDSAKLTGDIDRVTSEEIAYIVLLGENEDDIIGLGHERLEIGRTLVDLQGLYETRLKVCRDSIAKLRDAHETEIAKYDEDHAYARERIEDLEDTVENMRCRIPDLEAHCETLEFAAEDNDDAQRALNGALKLESF